MQAEAQNEHAWLRQLLGEWSVTSQHPGSEDEFSDWVEMVRPIGDLWVVSEGSGLMPNGKPGTTLMTIGFDPAQNRYVGSWVGSMMTHLWHYNGEVDASGKVLTLESEGPDFEKPGETANYRDIIEIVDDGERLFRAEVQNESGEWIEIMTARYRKIR